MKISRFGRKPALSRKGTRRTHPKTGEVLRKAGELGLDTSKTLSSPELTQWYINQFHELNPTLMR